MGNMRQGQHNNQHNKNRQRGRGNNRRSGGGNPNNRVYESNGPDVKVRGTAQHVADKYLQLARDAQSSGHLVTAENYFQHAEHYLRIVAANQPPQQPQQNQNNRADQDDADATQASSPCTPAEDNSQERKPRNPRGRRNVAPARASEDDQPSSEVNGSSESGDASAAWGGPQPEFLQRPAEPASEEQRPKRARKPRKAAVNGDADAKTTDGEKIEAVACAPAAPETASAGDGESAPS